MAHEAEWIEKTRTMFIAMRARARVTTTEFGTIGCALGIMINGARAVLRPAGKYHDVVSCVLVVGSLVSMIVGKRRAEEWGRATADPNVHRVAHNMPWRCATVFAVGAPWSNWDDMRTHLRMRLADRVDQTRPPTEHDWQDIAWVIYDELMS
jgi:hypothetical protein